MILFNLQEMNIFFVVINVFIKYSLVDISSHDVVKYYLNSNFIDKTNIENWFNYHLILSLLIFISFCFYFTRYNISNKTRYYTIPNYQNLEMR